MGLKPSILLQGGVWILRENKFFWQNSTNSPKTWNIWSLFSREGLPPTILQWFKIRSPANMLMMLQKFKRKNMCFLHFCQLVNTCFSWANTNQQFWAHFPIIPKHLNFCWEDFLIFVPPFGWLQESFKFIPPSAWAFQDDDRCTWTFANLTPGCRPKKLPLCQKLLIVFASFEWLICGVNSRFAQVNLWLTK